MHDFSGVTGLPEAIVAHWRMVVAAPSNLTEFLKKQQ
jgi:hypothetical protein